MHAIASRTLPSAARTPARVVAGRRYSRHFYSKASSSFPRRPGAPFEPAESALDQTEQDESNKRTEENVKPTKNPAEVAQGGQDEGPGRTMQLLSAARAEKGGKKSIPPPSIPRWFLMRNIKLAEETRDTLDPRPRSSYSCVLSVHNKDEDHASATIAVPSTQGDANRTFEELSSKLNPESPSQEASASEEKARQDTGWSPDFWIQAEIKAAISASLSIPQAGHNGFPAARSNIVLHSPTDGGIVFLSDLVKEIASTLGADVVQLDAQDIAELGADYVGDSAGANPHTIRNLGFETYQTPEYDYSEEELEENPEDDDNPESSSRPARRSRSTNPLGTSNGPNATSKEGLARQRRSKHMLKQLKDALKDAASPLVRVIGTMAPSDELALHRGPLSGIARREEPEASHQLNYLLAALVDANLEKRKTTNPSKRKSKGQDADFFTDSCPSETKELDISKTIFPDDPEGPKAHFKIAPAREAPASFSSDLKERKTIILVQDFKEMMNTDMGRSVLQRLAKVVLVKRRAGDRVMIIGASSAADLVPDLSPSGIRALQSEQEDDLFRTIIVPSAFATSPTEAESQSMTPQSKDQVASVDGSAEDSDDMEDEIENEDAWVKADRERMETINHRHLCDMIRRIDPAFADAASDLTLMHLKPVLGTETRPPLGLRPFSHEETHRICMTALGLRPLGQPSSESLAYQLKLAMTIIRHSDGAKFAWCAVQRNVEREMDPLASTEMEQRLETIKQNCNRHEKRLLSGVIDRANIKTTFTDVHAPSESIESLKTLTSLSMLRPDAFKYGVLATDKIPGLLLYGPPGTGKTLLAKAVARDSGATVLEISGANVNDMYVGEGEKNVKAIFSLARKLSPCVVFIDEADALFRTRAGSGSRVAHREIINQFLREWDGMDDLSVFIMVATNRPFDLDDAVLRRLPRRLLVDLPTDKDREAILTIHLKEEILSYDVSLSELATRTPFYSGSDLKNLCVAAALACVREENEVGAKAAEQGEKSHRYPEKRTLEARHFEKAIQEISASISEDMSSLAAIKKFDEQYGDRRGRRKKSGWGFTPVGGMGEPKEELARVRI